MELELFNKTYIDYIPIRELASEFSETDYKITWSYSPCKQFPIVFCCFFQPTRYRMDLMTLV